MDPRFLDASSGSQEPSVGSALQEKGRVTVAIVVSGRKEEGEGEERRRWRRGERAEPGEGTETKRADDGCDGDGQWLYTG